MSIDADLARRYESPEGAHAYREKYRRSLFRRLSNARELSVVRAALGRAGSAGRVLDCPCGAGRLVPVLLERAEHVTGADASASMVAEASDALAAEVGSGRVDLVVAPAERLPFEDGAFDTVVCHRLIHHVLEREDRHRILAELARVARRRVVLSFNDATTWKMGAQRRAGRARRRAAWTHDEIRDEARAAGLVLASRPRRLCGWFSLVAVAVFAKEDAPRA